MGMKSAFIEPVFVEPITAAPPERKTGGCQREVATTRYLEPKRNESANQAIQETKTG
jgi:hypothetical protein